MSDRYTVYEHTVKAGGYAGNRFFSGCTNEDTLHKYDNPSPNEMLIVIARCVPLNEAQNLSSLTPEICRLTAIIEEAFHNKNGQIDMNSFNIYMANNVFGIREDRKRRREHHLQPIVPYTFVEIGPENTEKNRLLRFIKDELAKKPDGTIPNLEFATSILSLKALAAYRRNKMLGSL